MSSADAETARAAFIGELRAAYAARRGATPALEAAVRVYARAMREAAIPIAPALVEVKDLVRAHTGYDEAIITPKVVGWAVVGYFAGTKRGDP